MLSAKIKILLLFNFFISILWTLKKKEKHTTDNTTNKGYVTVNTYELLFTDKSLIKPPPNALTEEMMKIPKISNLSLICPQVQYTYKIKHVTI